MIFNMIGGSSGGGDALLNFEVVGNPQPSSPKENTIWVNTDSAITGWHFSSEDPFNFKITSSAGQVVGTAGGITFTKKNAGRAIFTFARNDTYTIPLLLADTQSAAVLTSSMNATYDAYSFSYNGKTWYCTYPGLGMDLWETATPKISNTIDIAAIREYMIDMLDKAEGTVWISTGVVSTKEFNGLKENGIQIYPISVKHYINNAWVSKSAQIYQNSAWSSFTLYLFDNGDQCTSITGGWIGDNANDYGAYNVISLSPYWINGGYAGISNGQLQVGATMVDGYMGLGAACISTKNKIDLTGIKTIKVASTVAGSTTFAKVGVTLTNTIWNSSGYWNCAAYTALQNGTVTLDVSNLSGSYHIVFGTHVDDYENPSYFAVSEVSME